MKTEVPPYPRASSLAKWKLRFSRLALVLFSAIAGLLLCEVLTRLFAPQDLTGNWLEISPRGATINKAYWTSRHQGGQRVVYYHLNGLHLRGGAVGLGTNRVLCLGDSFTFGWLLAEKDTFVHRLNEKAQRDFPARTFEFLNGGICAGGSADFVTFIEEFARQIRPAAIVAFLNNDDVERAMQAGLFRLDPANIQTVTPVERHYRKGMLKYRLPRMATYQWLLEHSALTHLVRNALRGKVMTSHVEAVAASQKPAEDASGITLEKALFLRLRDWCNSNHCCLFVLTTGYNAFQEFPLWGDNGNANREFFREAPEFFSENGIRYYDLGPAMSAAVHGQFSAITIPEDLHPNERGDELIADLAWPWLKLQLQGILNPAGSDDVAK